MKLYKASVLTIGLLGVAALMMAGCGDKASESEGETNPPTNVSGGDDGHDLGGWWCNAHGIPEEECSLCSTKAAADFKAKGDWCEEHNRAESQCFLCDPSRAEKFAKLYEAKAGHAPPPRAE